MLRRSSPIADALGARSEPGQGWGPGSAVSPPRCTGPPLRLRRTLICVEPVQANETDVVPLASLQFTLEARTRVTGEHGVPECPKPLTASRSRAR